MSFFKKIFSKEKKVILDKGLEKSKYSFFYTPTELLENNIEPGKHFSKSLVWAQEFGYKPDACVNTEIIIKQVITLPIHKGVNKKVIKRMAEIVNKYA